MRTTSDMFSNSSIIGLLPPPSSLFFFSSFSPPHRYFVPGGRDRVYSLWWCKTRAATDFTIRYPAYLTTRFCLLLLSFAGLVRYSCAYSRQWPKEWINQQRNHAVLLRRESSCFVHSFPFFLFFFGTFFVFFFFALDHGLSVVM